MFANFNIHNSSREPIGRVTNNEIGLASVRHVQRKYTFLIEVSKTLIS